MGVPVKRFYHGLFWWALPWCPQWVSTSWGLNAGRPSDDYFWEMWLISSSSIVTWRNRKFVRPSCVYQVIPRQLSPATHLQVVHIDFTAGVDRYNDKLGIPRPWYFFCADMTPSKTDLIIGQVRSSYGSIYNSFRQPKMIWYAIFFFFFRGR